MQNRDFTMHMKRWITSLVALPLLIWLILETDPLLFAAFIALIYILSLLEYYRIVFPASDPTPNLLMRIWGGMGGLILIAAALSNVLQWVIGALALNFIGTGFIAVLVFRHENAVVPQAAKQIAGVLYVGLLLSCLVLLRNHPRGIYWIFFLLAVVFAGDVGAFYAGTRWGRRKLCPSVSPNKTVEGAAGGLLANLIVGGFFKVLLLPELAWGATFAGILCIGIAGQVGDLFESVLKRTSGVKDSGRLLPGHGGLLDRIDALLFAAAVAYMLQSYAG